MFSKFAKQRGFRPRPTQAEADWCKENYIETNSMRNMLSSYRELRLRLKSLGMSFEVLTSSIDYRTNKEAAIALKICIAGAFSGKYLECAYKD